MRSGGSCPRATSPAITVAAKSSGLVSASTPPARPMGVRTAAVMNASLT